LNQISMSENVKSSGSLLSFKEQNLTHGFLKRKSFRFCKTTGMLILMD